MDVGVTELRSQISHWLAMARDGHDVVVTDRGVPVARLVGLDSTPILERLVEQGVIARPDDTRRPIATGSARPRPRRRLSDVVAEQR